MADEQASNPYAAVLADLERQRAVIDADIAMIKRRMGLVVDETTPQSISVGSPSAAESSELRPDSFIGMSIRDAIVKYLRIVKRPKKTAEIARALEDGGLQHFSKRWFATVQTTLNRMSASGSVVRVPTGWGLLEWYPGRSFEKKAPTKSKVGKLRANRVTKHSAAEKNPSRQLQGQYLNLLKQVPAEYRDAYKRMAKEEGREKAISAMKRAVMNEQFKM